jgi:hypothetical protein
MLRRFGWHYFRVHAFELFSDPDVVANKVVTMLGGSMSTVTEPIAVVPQPGAARTEPAPSLAAQLAGAAPPIPSTRAEASDHASASGRPNLRAVPRIVDEDAPTDA